MTYVIQHTFLQVGEQMPPKCKYMSEQIAECAVKLTRRCGFDAVSARSVGAELGISSQPVYTAFGGMNELKKVVVEKAQQCYDDFCKSEFEKNAYPKYKCYGMAYIRFAMCEKELFKLLFMRDRMGEEIDTKLFNEIVEVIKSQTGLDERQAQLFHCETWASVHGIAVMAATGYQNWSIEEASNMISDIYRGLKYVHTGK